MLTQIDFHQFKCFRNLDLPLAGLTLLSGLNASGKSSILQALALLHQTMREHEWSSRLMLNGAAIRLGAAADVIDKLHGRRRCGIGLHDDERRRLRWEFEGEPEEMSLAVRRAWGETGAGNDWDVDGSQPLQYLIPRESLDDVTKPLAERIRGLAYLTAERLGPRETYTLDDPQLTPVVGSRGEHCVSILHSGRDTRVLDGLAISGAPPTRLRQIEAHMRRFFPGCELAVSEVPRASAVTLGLRTSSDTSFHRPIHTGFGLTQILPIVTAALSMNRAGLLLIENPEVHLHPAGQAEMDEFLADVASAGVQAIVETHSDHVLNGVRRAVKKQKIPADNVALHFFRPRGDDDEEGLPQVESPSLDNYGNIENWPEGFFDQFDKDMNYFAGWS